MATIDSMTEMLIDELKDIYDVEKRLTKAIPKLMKKAANEELRTALENHLAETEEHVTRVESAFEALGKTAKSKPCAGIQGIIEEANEHVGEDFEDDSLRDAVIIGSAQRAEHYEIAAYGTAIAHAKLLGLDEVVTTLEQTLEEEKAADEKLTEIAESVVNLEAADSEEAGESDDDEASDSGSGRGRSQMPPPRSKNGNSKGNQRSARGR
jgi:ferritin-like metal-binding protein YciE